MVHFLYASQKIKFNWCHTKLDLQSDVQ